MQSQDEAVELSMKDPMKVWELVDDEDVGMDDGVVGMESLIASIEAFM